METAGKLIAAALLCCILCLLLQKQAPELTLALCALGCVLCLLLTLPFFSQLLEFLKKLETLTGLSGAVFSPLLKTAAVGMLSQLAGALCRDGRAVRWDFVPVSVTAASGACVVASAEHDRRVACAAGC